MEQGPEKWTDPRIDDLRDGVKDLGRSIDARFAQMDTRFNQVDARFAQIDTRFNQVDARFARVDERFDALQRTLMLIGGGIIAALIALIATILGVALTQL
jgi:hypothetical protein